MQWNKINRGLYRGALLWAVLSGVALAGTVSVSNDAASGNTVVESSGQARVVVPVDGAGLRVCWFNGQQYSRGARLQAGKEWLECERENDNEINGALSWRPLGEARTSTSHGKITISQ